MIDPFVMLRFLDDAGLDPYQHRLMTHFWRRGECWESQRALAAVCGMSLGKVNEARQWLLDNGFIKLQPGRTGKMCIVVNVHKVNEYNNGANEDVHEMNDQDTEGVVDVHDTNTDVHHMNGDVHHVNAILNNKVNNQQQIPSPVRADSSSPKPKRYNGPAWKMPPELDNEVFTAAWFRWVVHYGEKTGRALTGFQGELIIAELAEIGLDRAVAAIDHSIKRGWKTIYEPEAALNGHKQNGGAATAADDENGGFYV